MGMLMSGTIFRLIPGQIKNFSKYDMNKYEENWKCSPSNVFVNTRSGLDVLFIW